MLDGIVRSPRIVLVGSALAVGTSAVGVGGLIDAEPKLAAVVAVGVLLVAAAVVVPSDVLRGSVLFVAWAAAVFTSEAAFGGAADASATATALTPTKLLPLAALAVLALLSIRDGIWATAPPAARLATAYFVWLGLAAVLSPHPSLSLGRVLQGAGPLFVVLVVRRRIAGAGLILVSATTAAAAAHVIWAVYHPYYTGVGTSQVRLVGLLIANSFEFAAGLTVVVGVVVWLTRLLGAKNWLGVPLALVGVVAVKESVGRTAAIAAVTAIAAAVLTRHDHERTGGRRTFVVGAAALSALLLLPNYVGTLTGWFRGGDQQLGTLTNRTLIWHTYVPQALEHPFVGLGPGALRFATSARTTDLPMFLSPGTSIGQAHNSLIEALIGGGLPAAALWLAMMSALLFQVLANRTRYRGLGVALFTVCLVESITISQLAGFGMAWYLLLALMALTAAPPRHAETESVEGTHDHPARSCPVV
jgi:hypothetical protein